MKTRNKYAEELSRQLFAIPQRERSEVFAAAISFQSHCSLGMALSVGPLRSVFADWWFEQFGEPIPIVALRKTLKAPRAISLAQKLSELSVSPHNEDLILRIKDLGVYLRKCGQLFEKRQQKLLFTDCIPQNTEFQRHLAPTSVSNLDVLIRSGSKFSTIYADPPWPYRNKSSRAAAENHYPTLSLHEIKAEPVAKLARDNAHLHLWTTNAFLREAFEVIDSWGFEFKSCLLWVKPNIGMGNYWRVSHEFLLLGVRGSLTFRERTQPSWLMANRTIHSRKPRQVRELIERVSYPPFLELYGREAFPNSDWTVYGNQIEHQLF